MLKKLLDILRRRKYISPDTRKEFNTDEKEKVNKEIEIIKDEILIARKKRLHLEVIREILSGHKEPYYESEIQSLNTLLENTGITTDN